jgi:hypothetical protein
MLSCYEEFSESAATLLYSAKPEVALGFNDHHARILINLTSDTPDLQEFSTKLKQFNNRLDKLHEVAAQCTSKRVGHIDSSRFAHQNRLLI